MWWLPVARRASRPPDGSGVVRESRCLRFSPSQRLFSGATDRHRPFLAYRFHCETGPRVERAVIEAVAPHQAFVYGGWLLSSPVRPPITASSASTEYPETSTTPAWCPKVPPRQSRWWWETHPPRNTTTGHHTQRPQGHGPVIGHMTDPECLVSPHALWEELCYRDIDHCGNVGGGWSNPTSFSKHGFNHNMAFVVHAVHSTNL